MIKDIRPNVKFLLDQLLAESEAHLCKFSTCVAAVPVPALTDTCSAHTATALTRHHGLGNVRGFFPEVSLTTWRAWFSREFFSFLFFEWLAADLRGRDGNPLQVRGDVSLPGLTRGDALRHFTVSLPGLPSP